MLVLSRRQNEKILLPNIQASIEVLDIRGDRVRIGIEAPADVTILREEVIRRDGWTAPEPKPSAAEQLLRKQRHQLRNHLNFASIGIALAKRQLQAGLVESVQTTLDKLNNGFQQIGDEVEHAPQNANRAGRQPKALLVEDDSNECELLAGFFRLAGYEVATAGDGTDALEYLEEHEKPDIMLLDMMLPRCDGPTTIKLVRKNPMLADLRIFAISGCTPDQLGLDVATAGVDRWFQKPLNPEALLRELSASYSIATAV